MSYYFLLHNYVIFCTPMTKLRQSDHAPAPSPGTHLQNIHFLVTLIFEFFVHVFFINEKFSAYNIFLSVSHLLTILTQPTHLTSFNSLVLAFTFIHFYISLTCASITTHNKTVNKKNKQLKNSNKSKNKTN